jgi:hypothetical protein
LTYDDNVTVAGGTPEIALTFETEVVGSPTATYAGGTGTSYTYF